MSLYKKSLQQRVPLDQVWAIRDGGYIADRKANRDEASRVLEQRTLDELTTTRFYPISHSTHPDTRTKQSVHYAPGVPSMDRFAFDSPPAALKALEVENMKEAQRSGRGRFSPQVLEFARQGYSLNDAERLAAGGASAVRVGTGPRAGRAPAVRFVQEKGSGAPLTERDNLNLRGEGAFLARHPVTGHYEATTCEMDHMPVDCRCAPISESVTQRTSFNAFPAATRSAYSRGLRTSVVTGRGY